MIIIKPLKNLFLKHPHENNMTYSEHFYNSFFMSTYLFISSIKAMIHSIFPFLYETSTTDCVKCINKQLNSMHSKI